jgi:hypothetical protein
VIKSYIKAATPCCFALRLDCLLPRTNLSRLDYQSLLPSSLRFRWISEGVFDQVAKRFGARDLVIGGPLKERLHQRLRQACADGRIVSGLRAASLGFLVDSY